MRDYITNLILFFTLFSINAYSSSISSVLASVNHPAAKPATVLHCAKGALCLPENISVAEAKK